MRFGHLSACVLLLLSSCDGSSDQSDYQYSKGPIPKEFSVGQSYPDRTEDQSCRPIQIHIERGSRRYNELVEYSNDNVWFATADSRTMSVRLHTQLNDLADAYYHEYGVKLLVEKAWTEYQDHEVLETSLHYEGRSIRIKVNKNNASQVLVLAAEIGFDWVHYDTKEYVTFCVIPDVCDAVVDLVFIQDQSGSVGQTGHDQSLQFMIDVVNFFQISPNETQVGLVTYSTEARVEFDLDDLQTKEEIQQEIASLPYPGGWTATALGLFQAGVILTPANGRGARPSSEGIPRIAVLITDGKSNQLPIDEVAVDLQNSGVQVYTVGIANFNLEELLFIASDPDFLHVFLLDSFSDAQGFVDFLSFTTCDTPAIVEPGENTTTEVPEDGFRFFQTECAAFAVTVVIEQIDIKGRCHLYASNTVQNPGPLDNSTSVVKNEDGTVTSRTVTLNVNQSVRKVIYVSVRGVEFVNVFSVIIWDRIFNEEEYTVYVSEGIVGYDVIDLVAELSIPNESFIYRIVDGNSGNEFRIGNTSGLLETNQALDVDVQMQYKLAIVAENIEASCHRGRVKVKVIVLPLNLTIGEVPEVFVAEDAEVGTNITRVQAMGTQELFQYAIIGGNIGNAFEIDSITGDVAVANLLDFEKVDSYRLTVEARVVLTFISATTVLNISIQDVNEAPLFRMDCALNNSCVFSVAENQIPPAFVGNLSADDPDRENLPSGMITYILNSAVFEIDGSGTIRTSLPLDREDQDEYDFTVTVSDGGNPSLSAETLVTVIVDDINDNPPVYVQFPSSIFLFESIRNGTAFATYLAEDDDIGENAEISYSVDQSDLPFGFPDPTNGLLTVIRPLDFESVQGYNFSVIASNPDGLNTSRDVMIAILDVNDNMPIFEEDVYSASVLENSSIGTFVINVTANDADSGINGMVNYSIIYGNVNNSFSIARFTGVITVSNELDREQMDTFTLTLRANDFGFPEMSGLATVIITVDDINDNAPMFLQDPYIATVLESLAAGLEVITVMAFDLDQPGTPNSNITYSILSGNEDGNFAIGMTSGEITVFTELDYENTSLFELEVLATDMGRPMMSDTAMVIINVANVNEHPPVISGSQTILVREDQPVGSVIAQFNASDLDQMTITFSIVNVNQEFSINSSTGVITLNQSLDFEILQQIVLQIEVSDGNQTDQATLTVNIIDVNEFPPVFQGQLAFTVDEESSVGTVVANITATDNDGSDSIIFSLWPSTVAGLFNIDPVSGVLTTATILDREMLVQEGLFQPPDSLEYLTIVATDTGIVPHSMRTEQNISITINDINDNVPLLDRSSYQASIPENMMQPTLLFNVLAMDPDLGTNGEIEYSLSGSALFSINSTTGQVSVDQPLDRETTDIHLFTIIASDRGNPSLSATAPANVIVIDVNDNNPQFTENEYETSVTENDPPRALLQIRANDADSNENGEVSFAIAGRENCMSSVPPSPCFFSIDADGIFENTVPLDFETASQYVVTVVATDNGIPPLSNTTIVTINVENVDEFPPTFLGPCNASLPETEETGVIVTRCPAEDFDDVQNATSSNTIVYSITAGNQGNTFTVDGNGTIRNSLPLDRETISQYTLQLNIADEAGLSSSMQVEITVTDINDNAPEFINEPYTAAVDTDSLGAGFLIDTEAIDQDQGQNAQISYSLVGMNQNTMNRETTLTVAATDGGNPSLSANTTVTITFSTPCSKQEYMVESLSGVVTGLFLCSIDIQPLEQQVIINSTYSFTCIVMSNVPGAVVRLLHNSSRTGDEMVLSGTETNVLFERFNAAFVDSGPYLCEVTSTIGSILSPNSSIVSIVVPPEIILPPNDAIVIEGQFATFQCGSIGIPDPVQTWLRDQPSGLAQLSTEGRVTVLDEFLLINTVTQDDDGTYICQATNVAGQDEASAELVVVGLSSIVIVTIENVSDPDVSRRCNSFDTNGFQNVMTDITGQDTVATDMNGTFLCNPDPCHPSPCENNGMCNITADGGYTCACLLGYTGSNCETDIDECTGVVCLNGATCTNTPGAFECQCPPGFTGDRCEFNPALCLCPPNTQCVEIESVNECIPTNSNSQLLISQPRVDSTTILNQQVNLFQEDSPNESRRKRDTFVTVCYGAFYPVNGSDNMLSLSWACPDGVDLPTEEELVEICQELVQWGLVEECVTPGGNQFTIPDIPSSTVDVFFVILNGRTGRPLNASQTLDLLERTNALQRLQEEGYDVVGFRTAVPQSTNTGTTTNVATTNVAAIVGGVVAAIILVILVVIIVAVVLTMRRQRRSKSSRYSEVVLSNTSTTKSLESRFNKMDELMVPINTSAENAYMKYELQNGSQEECPQSPDSMPYAMFDDPIYSETNLQEFHRGPRKKTLSFGKKIKLHHTDSTENLLDDDKDRMSDSQSSQPQIPPKPSASQHPQIRVNEDDEEEQIYGNMNYQGGGNAGERWENYWKTSTVLRGLNAPKKT